MTLGIVTSGQPKSQCEKIVNQFPFASSFLFYLCILCHRYDPTCDQAKSGRSEHKHGLLIDHTSDSWFSTFDRPI